MFRITNTGRGPVGVYDRSKRLHQITGGKSVEIEMDASVARRMQVRGGKIKVQSVGGQSFESPDRDEQQAERASPHPMPQPKNAEHEQADRKTASHELADRGDEMTFADFREASIPFLGETLPRSKKGIQDALRAL